MNADTREAMKSIGSSVSIKNRFIFAFNGLLCLFFPGFILTLTVKSAAAAYKKLSAEEQAILSSILFSSDD